MQCDFEAHSVLVAPWSHVPDDVAKEIVPLPITLIYGDNQLEIDDAVRTIRAPFNDADVLTFDAPSASLSMIAEASRTAGLFDPERLVIVHDLHEKFKTGRKDSGDGDEIRNIVNGVAPTTTLLLLSSGMSPDNPLTKYVRDSGGTARSLTVPRKGDAPRWILARSKRHAVSVDREAAELLVDLIGVDTVALDTEIEKLATYVGSGGRIDVAAVDILVGAVPQDSIFTLVDAIAAGDRSAAFTLLHAQVQSASTNPLDFALYLIRMLARQMRILLRIRLGQTARRSQRDIASALRLPPYYVDRYFRQATRLSQGQLQAAFERLAALEYALKQGKADASTGLDLLVEELCA